MKHALTLAGMSAAVLLIAANAIASELEAECLAASEEWGSTGDVEAQCSCIANAVADDEALYSEFMAFRHNYSNDSEAYDGASESAKTVMDQCSVET